MKTYRLTKGEVTINIRVGKHDAEMKRHVGGNRDTSSKSMTPIEAQRKVSSLVLEGYRLQASKPVK